MSKPRVSVRIVAVLVIMCGTLLAQAGPALAQTPGSTPSTDSNATFAKGACPWELPKVLKEGQNIECGMVTVPLFHNDPTGDTIQLAVGIIAPSRGDPSGPPIFILNGGPGGDSTAILSLFEPDSTASVAPLMKDHEVVVFDQRGTGASLPGLYCAGDYNDTTDETIGTSTPVPEAATAEATASDIKAQASECASDLSNETDLEAYTTDESAMDINDIRVALGFDKINLWGQSYGTRLALEAMREYPKGVIDSVVLESVLPPDVPFLSTAIVGFNDSFKRIADACASDRQCHRAYPDVEGDFAKAVKYFSDNPYKTSFKDATTGQKTPVTVDGATFSGLVYQTVFSGILIRAVPQMLHQASDGDTTLVDALLPLLSASGVASGFYYSVVCQDELPLQTEKQYDQVIHSDDILPVVQETQLGSPGSGYYAACDGFDVSPSPAADREPVTTDIRTLLVSGEYDPITPPSNAEHAAKTLSDAQTVVASGLAHTPILFSQDCLLAGTIDFLDHTNADFGCASDRSISFITGS